MASAHSEFKKLRIVLLGNTGVGKSATANVLIGRDSFKETETRECEIRHGRVKDRNNSVIDTPGINNTSITPEQMRDQIKKCMLLSSPGPHVFLLVIRLGRFTEDERDAVKWIQENFGEEALMFTMVLFTGKEGMTISQLNTYFQDDMIQKLIISCGGGYDVINSKREVNPAQITKLLEKIKAVIELDGGKFYTDEMYQEAQRKTREKEDNERIKREENKRRERQGNERTELSRGITERGENEIIELTTGSTERRNGERMELSRERIERGENERKEREENERIKKELNETSERQTIERTELTRRIIERGEHERIELSRGSTEKRRGKRIEKVEYESIDWCTQRIERGENERRERSNNLPYLFAVAGIALILFKVVFR